MVLGNDICPVCRDPICAASAHGITDEQRRGVLALVHPSEESYKPCESGHTWTHHYGDDWTPERGTPCDCGQKQWGIPLTIAREHEWEFYANGSFCRRCGAALGDGSVCR